MITQMTTKQSIGPQTVIYPMPALVVGTMVNDKPNFMTAAWSGIACSEPPMLSVAIREQRHTRKGISLKSHFSINIPRANQAEWVDYVGIASGKNEDKNKIAGIEVIFDEPSHTPMINNCPVCLACRVEHILSLGTHDLVIGEIIQTYVDEDCLTNGKPDASKINPLVYAAGQANYHSLGPIVAKAFSVGTKLKRSS